MGDLSDFQRGQTVDARLAGAFVITAVSLLGVCGGYGGTQIVGRLHQLKGTVAEN